MSLALLHRDERFAFVRTHPTPVVRNHFRRKRIETLAQRPGTRSRRGLTAAWERPETVPGRDEEESARMTEKSVTVYSSPT